MRHPDASGEIVVVRVQPEEEPEGVVNGHGICLRSAAGRCVWGAPRVRFNITHVMGE